MGRQIGADAKIDAVTSELAVLAVLEEKKVEEEEEEEIRDDDDDDGVAASAQGSPA